MINGSDGTFFSPFRKRDDVLYAFSPDMCRSYKLTYLKDNVVDGINTYDFHLPHDIFYNDVPGNEGFCDEGYCLGNGVLNISKCYGGISGFVSQPHFLNAETKFRDAIDGMMPNQDIHDFVLHFEPTAGVPIAGNIRLQINFFMIRNEKIG
jgi:lysosome membrane protein 2